MRQVERSFSAHFAGIVYKPSVRFGQMNRTSRFFQCETVYLKIHDWSLGIQ